LSEVQNVVASFWTRKNNDDDDDPSRRVGPTCGRATFPPGAMASPDDHTSFRALTRRRILDDMLGKVSAQGGGEWKVLVLDPVTVRVVSSSCGMSDLTGAGVSLVENLAQGREPQRSLDAVYFITPTPESVERLCADFAAKKPEARLYRRAHVFFSSPCAPAQLAAVKKCRGLVDALGSLAELNLEYVAKDARTFITDQPDALRVFFGAPDPSRDPAFAAEAERVAVRIATLLASLGEFPATRHAAAVGSGTGTSSPGTSSPAAAVAQRVHRRMLAMRAVPGQTAVPSAPTCDLLVLDRSSDVVAPVAREWTYEAMVHDLLPVSPLGVYRYDIETNAGRQRKEAVLGECDPLWVELRHAHIASALNTLAEKAREFSERGGGRLTGESTTGSIKRAVENLPRFMEAQAKLSVHTSIAAQINAILRDRGLSEIGHVEESVVFGEATSKDVVALLNAFKARDADMSQADKLRLLLLYAASHPEKFDDAERARWAKLTGLTPGDLAAVSNLERLGAKIEKPKRGGAAATFRTTKAKRPIVHSRKSEWDLNRFVPAVNALAVALDDGTLSRVDFPEVDAGGGGGGGGGGDPFAARAAAGDPFAATVAATASGGSPSRATGPGGSSAPPKTPGKSARTARVAGGWARRSVGEDGELDFAAGGGGGGGAGAGGGAHHRRRSSVVSAPVGRRLIVFVVGGVTRGETREAHALARSLGRDVIIGGTDVFSPEQFVRRLAGLGGGEGFVRALAKDDDDVDLDDIVIED
jgi:syntaxin-binding protein 1